MRSRGEAGAIFGEALGLVPGVVRAIGLSRLARALGGSRRVSSQHPKAAHWYLFSFGVDPARQGRGVLRLAKERVRHEAVERRDRLMAIGRRVSSEQQHALTHADEKHTHSLTEGCGLEDLYGPLAANEWAALPTA